MALVQADYVDLNTGSTANLGTSTKVTSILGSVTAIIGDESNATFRPTIKILRQFFEDANFTISFNEPALSIGSAAVSIENKIVKYKLTGSELWFYQLPNSKEIPEGGFEFMAKLDSKPAKNTISFQINAPNLEFLYQPPLTEENYSKDFDCTETLCINSKANYTVKRPANVVGSYAVYHSTKANNQYGTGKVGHIYRPYVNDSLGTFVWANLTIDKEIMTITIPQEFLDNAVYPIFIDPSFGYTIAGGSASGSDTADANRGIESTYLASEGDTLTKFAYYGASSDAVTDAFDMVLYTYELTLPVTKSGTQVTTVPGYTTTWHFVNASHTMTAGVRYTIARGNQTTTAIDLNFDSDSPPFASKQTSLTLGTTWTEASNSAIKWSWYANYTNIPLAVPKSYYNSTNGSTVAGSLMTHNLYWNISSESLSGYIFSFHNGGNTSALFSSPDLLNGQIQANTTMVWTNYSTGVLNPTTNAVLAGQGWYEPTKAYTKNNVPISFAQTARNGANQTAYNGFASNIPAGSNILSIQTYINASCASSTGTNPIRLRMSNNSGATYAGLLYTPVSDYGTAYTYTISPNGGLWGLTWNSTTANLLSVNVTGYASAVGSFLRLDYIGINITYANQTPTTDKNSTINYFNYGASGISNIANIFVKVNVSYYNNTKSLGYSVNPDLWLEIYNGSRYITIGNMTITGTGNFTVSIPNTDNIYSQWSNPTKQNISIKGVYLDSNSTLMDQINYSDVWIDIHTSSYWVNDSFVPMTGNGNWSNVTKTLNSTSGLPIEWQVHANSTNNKWNASSVYSYLTTSGGGPTISFTVYTLGGGSNSTNSDPTTATNTEAIYFNASSLWQWWIKPCANADGVTNCQNGMGRPIYRIVNTGSVSISYFLKLDSSLSGTPFKSCANSTANGAGVTNTVSSCDLGSEGNLNATDWLLLGTLSTNSQLNITRYANSTGTVPVSYLRYDKHNSTT
jgi:hypothetical protein